MARLKEITGIPLTEEETEFVRGECHHSGFNAPDEEVKFEKAKGNIPEMCDRTPSSMSTDAVKVTGQWLTENEKETIRTGRTGNHRSSGNFVDSLMKQDTSRFFGKGLDETTREFIKHTKNLGDTEIPDDMHPAELDLSLPPLTEKDIQEARERSKTPGTFEYAMRSCFFKDEASIADTMEETTDVIERRVGERRGRVFGSGLTEEELYYVKHYRNIGDEKVPDGEMPKELDFGQMARDLEKGCAEADERGDVYIPGTFDYAMRNAYVKEKPVEERNVQDNDYEGLKRIVVFSAEIENTIKDFGDFSKFKDDKNFQRSCLVSIEQISESVRTLSTQIKKHMKDVKWGSICRQADIIKIYYDEIDYSLIWESCSVSIPETKKACISMLKRLEKTPLGTVQDFYV